MTSSARQTIGCGKINVVSSCALAFEGLERVEDEVDGDDDVLDRSQTWAQQVYGGHREFSSKALMIVNLWGTHFYGVVARCGKYTAGGESPDTDKHVGDGKGMIGKSAVGYWKVILKFVGEKPIA